MLLLSMTLRTSRFLVLTLLLLLGGMTSLVSGQGRSPGDILAGRPDLSSPENRGAIVSEMRRGEQERKAAALERAREAGLPIRIVGPGYQVAELMEFIDDEPLYAVTTNREAAISTAADSTRTSFNVDGGGFTIGIWDGGSVRSTHQEFDNRISIINDVPSITHATHIAGTIAAAGITERARGMAPAARIDSYDWNNDKSEMTSRGASYPGEPGAIYLSNHSYSYRTGWSRTGNSNPQWEWLGIGSDRHAVDQRFGQYNSFARDMDSLAYNLPYYLAFWAAGNDRGDNPTEGSSVRIGNDTVSYNSSWHPPGDGRYKDGYDTIGFQSLAKNVITVGSVNDAVTAGSRDLSKASISSFSSWGPTDDGRIKPDVVANGASLYSTTASGDTTYGFSSGTSMAAPNATGSAQLLISYFDQRFPGHRLRASTLKGLIIHTADDLGTPGPNYQFGWGLMNTQAAAEHIAAHRASPGSHQMVEARLTNDDPAHTYTFTWDGVSPIRTTLTWTDPPASSTSNHDDRSPRLINNLDLEIHGPDDSLHQPYVMPYVGDWREEMLSAPATTGKNDTDNVEQVFIATPPAPGVYTATVTFDGNLTDNAQDYSLMISGAAATEAPPPEISSISPDQSNSSLTTMTLHGHGFQLGADFALEFPEEDGRHGMSHEVSPNRITVRLDTDEMRGGLWDVVVQNPDGQRTVYPGGFAVAAPFWSEDFESGAPGWSGEASSGTSNWTLSDAASRSPTHAYFAPGPPNQRVDNLYSPVIEVPSDSDDLTFSFWHSHSFATNHGGVLEFSVDGGSWFSPSSSSGASFSSGGYNGEVRGQGRPQSQNALGNRAAWTGSNSGFSEVTVTLDASTFAGKSFQARWRLGTNQESTSPGWSIDDVALQSAGPPTFPTTQITLAPTASESPVTGTSVDLHVEAETSDGSDEIIYTWTVNDSSDFPIEFNDNATATANSTTATFSSTGSYRFEVNARNSFNQSTSSEIDVVVEPAPTSVEVSPPSPTIPVGGQITFDAITLDQFNLPLAEQPPAEWSIDPAAGEITPAGLFTAADSPGGPYLLTATTLESLTGNTEVTLRERGYVDWLETYLSDDEQADAALSADTADPDQDGVPNLLEYALGGNPVQPDRGILPQTKLEDSENGEKLVFTFSRPIGLTDLEYRVEASSDLAHWTSIPREEWEVEPNGESETIIIRQPLASPHRFIRLQVERL